MIDTLVAFGCSSTFGSETVATGDNYNPDSIYRAYPYYLSKKLGLQNYYNQAYPGESNLVIAYKVLQHVLNKDKRNEFHVIGWTNDNRFPVVYKRELKTIKIHGDTDWIKTFKRFHNLLDGSDRNPRFLEILKGHWVNAKSNALDAFRDLMTVYFFETPYNTALNALIKFATTALLDRLNISYLSLPAFLYIDHPLYSYLTTPNNILPYDKDMNVVFSFDGFREDPNSKRHLSSSEHEALAAYLYQYIVSNNLLPAK